MPSPRVSFTRSFQCAFSGVVACWKKGRNIRVQAVGAGIAIVLGLALGISPLEWVAIVVCIGLVLSAECMNTALEDAVDLTTTEIHPLAKSAKDMAAGAVVILACMSVVVGAIIYIPHVMALFA